MRPRAPTPAGEMGCGVRPGGVEETLAEGHRQLPMMLGKTHKLTGMFVDRCRS
jgi:hypothetical protein